MEKDVYNFLNNVNIVQHKIIVLRAVTSVRKSNAEVEIQCTGHFEVIFGYLSSSFSKGINFLFKIYSNKI